MPVRARPMTSLPAKISLNVAAWIGKRASTPRARSAPTVSSDSSNWSSASDGSPRESSASVGTAAAASSSSSSSSSSSDSESSAGGGSATSSTLGFLGFGAALDALGAGASASRTRFFGAALTGATASSNGSFCLARTFFESLVGSSFFSTAPVAALAFISPITAVIARFFAFIVVDMPSEIIEIVRQTSSGWTWTARRRLQRCSMHAVGLRKQRLLARLPWSGRRLGTP